MKDSRWMDVSNTAVREIAQRSLAAALIYFFVTIVLFTFTDYPSVDMPVLMMSSVVQLVVGGIRIASAFAVIRRAPPLWLKQLMMLSVFGQFLAWGLFAGYSLYRHGDTWMCTLVLLSSAALSAGATSSLAPSRLLSFSCLTGMTLPVGVAALFRPEPEIHGFGLATAIYFGFLLGQAQMNWTRFWAAARATDADSARASAEKIAQVKASMLAQMSHEIRTPMNGVIGMLELLLGSGLKGEPLDLATKARSSAQHLLDVVNRILDFSKNESKGVTLHDGPFELLAWLRTVAAPFEVEARAKGLDLRCHCTPPSPAWFDGDAVRLAQVLSNLLSNAVKHTVAGSINVRASEEEGGVLRLEVADTGPGMTPLVRDRLFRPFEHGGRVPGTGLGLVITRQIVEAMGGTLHVDSEPDCGTTITARVRLERTTAPAAARPPVDTPAAPHAAEGRRVLVVEDDPVSQVVARRLLEKSGAEVSTATSVAESRAYLAAARFDFVLADVQLPDGEGFDLVPILPASTTFIVVSASSAPETLEHARQKGARYFLTKPYSALELRDVLRRASPRAAGAGSSGV